MTFMRKILDTLNMDNWNKDIEPGYNTKESTPPDIPQGITEEEIIESFKKQYYIIDEEPKKESGNVCNETDIDKEHKKESENVCILNEYEPEKNKQQSKEDEEKDRILSLLELKIECASKLISIAKSTSNETEFNNCINEIKSLFSEFSKSEPGPEKEKREEVKDNNAYSKYYENIRKQRESNLNISYEDVKDYDMKPFDLKGKFITDGNFTVIELSGNNLEIAYKYLKSINYMLYPYKNLYEDTEIPDKISTKYMSRKKLPTSHLRLIPYTATMRKSKYPLCLCLSNTGEYGTKFLYAVYFDRDGDIGQCELSLYGSEGIGISYETKIRRDENGLYILRISKTLYSPPFGTTTIYHRRDGISYNYDSKTENKFDLDSYAKECNAYITRKERNNND